MAGNNRRCGKWFLPVMAFLAGIVVITGANLALDATDSAAFCGSCHVMSEAVWTHSQSVHAKLACNECHIPHDSLAAKLPYKTIVGINDVAVNSFSNVDDNIRANEKTRSIVRDNCVRCHYSTIKEVNMEAKEQCTGCHRSVPHINKLPIAKRRAADV